MKRVNLLAIVISYMFILCGCSVWDDEHEIVPHDHLTFPGADALQADGSVLKSAGKHNIAFKGKINLWSGPVPAGSELLLEVDGNGIVTHMGKSRLSMTKTVNTYAYPDPPQPWEAFAELVLTNAKGEELFFHFDFCTIDRSNPPNFTFKASCAITGGTGRFKEATGTIEYFETFSWFDAKGTLNLYGTVNF